MSLYAYSALRDLGKLKMDSFNTMRIQVNE